MSRGRVGCVVGVAVGAGCWGGVLGREVGVVSGLPRMPRIKLAPLYHPDTLLNPDTCLGLQHYNKGSNLNFPASKVDVTIFF